MKKNTLSSFFMLIAFTETETVDSNQHSASNFKMDKDAVKNLKPNEDVK